MNVLIILTTFFMTSIVWCTTEGIVGYAAATIELVLINDDKVRTSKYIRGRYTTAGAASSAEGRLAQVHPNELCSSSPNIKDFYIYILKLEPKSTGSRNQNSCESAADKAAIAIRNGAAAIVLIATGVVEETINKLKDIAQPLERPVIIIDEVPEEDKLFALIKNKYSRYMKISPVKITDNGAISAPIESSRSNIYPKERLTTYIGIAVIFGVILVTLLIIAAAVILKMHNTRHRIQTQNRERFLQSIGTHKYRRRKINSPLSYGHQTDSPGPCPICLEQYQLGEELRLLPCTHQYHKKCIDKWLMEHSTCPCCCGDIEELLRLGIERHKESYSKTATSSSAPSHIHKHCATKPLLNSSSNHPYYKYKPGVISYDDGAMRELLPPNNREAYVHRQYQYLLHKLHEIKSQRPSSITVSDTEASNRFSMLSSCYGSNFDIESSIPCENSFIGDCCQGGVPKQCDEMSFCDIEIDCKQQSIKQYTSSKSTLPSVESTSMSPRVSEMNLSIDSSNLEPKCSKCHSRSHHQSAQDKHKHKLDSKLRTVRFREPESEVMSSADDDIEACGCESCQLCEQKTSTGSSDTSKYASLSSSDQDPSASNNVLIDERCNSEENVMTKYSS